MIRQTLAPTLLFCASALMAQDRPENHAPQQGLLVPMLQDEQMRNTAPSGQGQLVYNSTAHGFYYFNGTDWEPLLVAETGEDGAGIHWTVQRTEGLGAPKVSNGNTGFWDLTGNAATDATNFLGTTDGQPLRIRVNNTGSGYVSSGPYGTVALGYSTGASAGGTSQNTFIGGKAGTAITTGFGNTCIGSNAGAGTTLNIYSTYVGANSGMFSDAPGNAFLGAESGMSNLTGVGNTFLGKSSGMSNTTGTTNTMIGLSAGSGNTTGNSNIIMGNQAGQSNTTGSSNIIIGAMSGWANISGSNNTLLGAGANFGAAALTNATVIGAGAQVDVSNALVLGASGTNVGIGTTAPTERLHVVGSIRLVDSFQGAGKVLTSDANGKGTWQALPAASNDWTLLGNAGTNAATNFIGTTDAVDLRLRTSNLERLSITSTGKVGVGTNTATTSLQVNGGITTQPANTIALTNVGNTITVGDRSYIRITNTIANAVVRFTDGLSVGQVLIVHNLGTGQMLPFTVNDDPLTSNCELGANRQLGLRDMLTMIWDGSDWVEQAFANN